MKIEQLIVQHLYNSKKVTLQGIGTFRLNPSISLPADDKDRNFVMPENAFEFDYNLKATEDQDLIHYIVKHTNKILPLATADLDSYVILAKQFLNIGKPLVIEGVGTIQKNQAGIYQFNAGEFVTPRIDDIPKQAREKRDETVSFESEGPQKNSWRNLLIFVTILIVAAAAFGIYYMVNQEDTAKTSEPVETVSSTQTDTVATIDTAGANVPALDTTTTIVAAPIVRTDTTSSFQVVLKTYPSSALAQKAMQRLTTYGHKLVVNQLDSSRYEVAMPFKSPLSDTARAKDSLRRFFGGKPYIKL
ncbi:MAG: hypothetical protein V4725_18360 [Bacteroidota bacterium]